MPLWQPFAAAAVAVPIVVTKGILSARARNNPEIDSSGEDVGGDGSSFVCERVCTSDRLLRRLGKLAKDPTPHSCITVCGVSAHDACVEACQRSVCSIPHQVPAWNESCLKRCTAECIKGRAG
ncbi:hypothetical protein Rsub_05939 [Raphidocelis subcapitata]|uniref:Uncharacterized protein n=1 Tax=Raphidocelis subcapitata TaxID=307507 RepID=A0A2V0P7P4_9CHLO|nr:hypothetical protein Rsub_05939 [Raphidocelis subcapitata]|eukprot:GBF93207.1 hypothetical protein Rsub_05939 [Raphidocelis subcapitata]